MKTPIKTKTLREIVFGRNKSPKAKALQNKIKLDTKAPSYLKDDLRRYMREHKNDNFENTHKSAKRIRGETLRGGN